MDDKEKYTEITMIREHLGEIESYELSDEYSVRWYQPGYEKLWMDIHLQSEKYISITPGFFEDKFGTDAQVLAERQCFIFDKDNNAIATATAWFDDNFNGQKYGKVHWVAIVPRMHGRGLAKPLLSIVYNKLRSLGHERAYLITANKRIAAVSLYLKFGFVPKINSPEELGVWRRLEKKLKYPLPLNLDSLCND